MNNEGMIEIRPLTVRGTFGIAWKLIGRRTGSLVGYTVIIVLLMALLFAAAFSPVIVDTIVLYANNDTFSASDGLALIVDVIVSLLLMGVAALIVALLIRPIFTGTLYGELSSRIYAGGASCGALLKRGKFSLKRYFSTAMSLLVCYIIINIVTSTVSSIVTSAASISGLAADFPNAASYGSGDLEAMQGEFLAFIKDFGGQFIGIYIGVMLFALAVTLCADVFLAFVYPIAVNENIKNFTAVGRSFSLASKRFGRILGCKVLAALMQFGISLAIALIGTLLTMGLVSLEAPDVVSALIIIVMILLLWCSSIVFILFNPALETVLYYDTRVRLEGNGFMYTSSSEAQQNAPRYYSPDQGNAAQSFYEPAGSEAQYTNAPANEPEFYIPEDENNRGGDDR